MTRCHEPGATVRDGCWTDGSNRTTTKTASRKWWKFPSKTSWTLVHSSDLGNVIIRILCYIAGREKFNDIRCTNHPQVVTNSPFSVLICIEIFACIYMYIYIHISLHVCTECTCICTYFFNTWKNLPFEAAFPLGPLHPRHKITPKAHISEAELCSWPRVVFGLCIGGQQTLGKISCPKIWGVRFL